MPLVRLNRIIGGYNGLPFRQGIAGAINDYDHGSSDRSLAMLTAADIAALQKRLDSQFERVLISARAARGTIGRHCAVSLWPNAVELSIWIFPPCL